MTGITGQIIEAVKTLTFTNVMVILLFVVGMAPAYLAWRILNDDELRDIVFSSFTSLTVAGLHCSFNVASEIGEEKSWFIAHDFAMAGRDRWYVGVNTLTEPTPEQIEEYCKVLGQLIIYARHRSVDKPLFPGDEPTIEVQP
jgi:hypothetical protein